MKVLPWSDSAPAVETRVIVDRLLRLNTRHVWTTNSQPAVDGARADHPAHGWGPSADGYVYQKAYLEFFLPTRLVPALLRLLGAPRYEHRINYHILDAAGTPPPPTSTSLLRLVSSVSCSSGRCIRESGVHLSLALRVSCGLWPMIQPEQ